MAGRRRGGGQSNIPRRDPDQVLKKQAFGIAMYGPAEEYLSEEERALKSRNDGVNTLLPSEEALRTRLAAYSSDSDYGVGYEVVNPAKSANPLGRARAQKIGYNRELEYLAILMRDGNMIGYQGVSPEEWAEYQNYSSTSDYIDSVLSRYNGGGWDMIGMGMVPPQSNEQLFEQGRQD
jgi:hypothetical protein